MKKVFAVALVLISAQVVVAEASYEYAGPRTRPAAAYQSGSIPAPTPWTPPHRLPVAKYNHDKGFSLKSSPGMNFNFSGPAFNLAPATSANFSSPSAAALNPVNIQGTGFNSVVVPQTSNPSATAPSINLPSQFNVKNYSNP